MEDWIVFILGFTQFLLAQAEKEALAMMDAAQIRPVGEAA